jgi:hypothetical protein
MPRVATPWTLSYRSLQGRWDVIKACCSWWSGAMEQVRNEPPVSPLSMTMWVHFILHWFCDCVAHGLAFSLHLHCICFAIVGSYCNGEV